MKVSLREISEVGWLDVFPGRLQAFSRYDSEVSINEINERYGGNLVFIALQALYDRKSIDIYTKNRLVKTYSDKMKKVIDNFLFSSIARELKNAFDDGDEPEKPAAMIDQALRRSKEVKSELVGKMQSSFEIADIASRDRYKADYRMVDAMRILYVKPTNLDLSFRQLHKAYKLVMKACWDNYVKNAKDLFTDIELDL